MNEMTATLRLPSTVHLSESLRNQYPEGELTLDATQRQEFNAKHRELLLALAGQGQRFRCTCQPGRVLEIIIRVRNGEPYIARLAKTGPQHDSACCFFPMSVTSHSLASLKENSDGTVSVRLGFRLGENGRGRKNGTEDGSLKSELELRRRHFGRPLNCMGLDGLLRLLFDRAGLHQWRSGFRREHRFIDGKWTPTYHRLLMALRTVKGMGQKQETLQEYVRIGKPGWVAAFREGTLLAVVDAIIRIEPPRKGYYWKCYLAGWEQTFLVIDVPQVRALLAQLRFHPDRIQSHLETRESAQPREGEVWWGCLLVRVEQGETGKWYRILDHAALRSDPNAIPVESLAEIEMASYLIENRRGFCKPLFPGRLSAVPNRRPDFVLEDTLAPRCIEVAGMDGAYDYDDRDEERLEEYRAAGVLYIRWESNTTKPLLDGDFSPVR